MKLEIELVRAAKSGNKDCFTQLYEQVAPGLYRSALYTLGNRHDAEDVVSETFLEAWHGIGALREEGAFATWIYRILSARCKRKIKEYVKGRSTFDIDQFPEEGFAAPEGVQQEGIGAAIERVDLLHAMESLSPVERQIICLSVLDGYTTKEISQIIRSPHGTVSSKLFRALKKLRKLLEESH